MNSTFKTTCVLAAMLITTTASALANEVQQADKSMAKSASQADASLDDAASVKPFSGRLPRYYAALVDSQQRTAIYAIQMRFYEQIESLEQRLAALKETEMKEIENVLTAAQRKQLESLRSRAARRVNSSASVEPSPEADVEQADEPMPSKPTK